MASLIPQKIVGAQETHCSIKNPLSKKFDGGLYFGNMFAKFVDGLMIFTMKVAFLPLIQSSFCPIFLTHFRCGYFFWFCRFLLFGYCVYSGPLRRVQAAPNQYQIQCSSPAEIKSNDRYPGLHIDQLVKAYDTLVLLSAEAPSPPASPHFLRLVSRTCASSSQSHTSAYSLSFPR